MTCWRWQPEVLVATIVTEGGVTVDWQTGERPTQGYAVAPSAVTELHVPLDALTVELVEAYVARFSSLLALPGMCFGARVKEGSIYLDVSIVVDDRAVAAALAQDARQFAIRSLHEAASLPVDELSSHEADSITAARGGFLYRTLRQEIDTAIATVDL
jgi:hypothetical protein